MVRSGTLMAASLIPITPPPFPPHALALPHRCYRALCTGGRQRSAAHGHYQVV